MSEATTRPASSPGEATAASSLPDHLVPLPGGRWAVWRLLCLRGSGFPIDGVRRLASPACAAAADALLAAEEAAGEERSAALAAVRRQLDRLEGVDKERRRPLVKVLRKLKAGKLPAPSAAVPGVELAALEAAEREVGSARESFRQAYREARIELSYTLRDFAREPRFREALLWQNPRVLETAVEPLLRKPAGRAERKSQERQHEELVASYVQRYCTKNDTIGFFGPVGWAELDPQADPIRLRPGAGLLAERRVFFEDWCVATIAERLAEGRPLGPWLPPRKLPFFFLEGDLYCSLVAEPVRLSTEELAVFRACDGRRLAREIAVELTADPGLELTRDDQVYEILEALAARGMIVWKLEVPLAMDSERLLRQQIERIGAAEHREPMLAALSGFEAARDRVAEAAGDPEGLADGLAALEERFVELTGVSSRRSDGETYAGRTLVYEDCRRDLELTLGADVLDALGAPLSLVLKSARWLTHEIGVEYARRFQAAYEAMRSETGEAVLPLGRFLGHIRELVLEPNSSLVVERVRTMQERWVDLLAIPEGNRRLRTTVEELAPRVEDAFAAPGPGWKLARHQCPDVLICAESAEAIGRGDYSFVLGETHVATNTLRTTLFVAQHPTPEELTRAMVADIPEPTVFPWMPPRHDERIETEALGFEVPPGTARIDFGLLADKDVRISLTGDPPGDPEATTLFVGDLFVADEEGELRVRTRDGRHRFALLDFFELALSAQTLKSYRLLPHRPHTPRIEVDRLVLHRESWTLPLGEARFPGEKTESGRFEAARRWARGHGLPRFVFVWVPFEPKPMFVDFDSPLAIEILARSARRAITHGDEDVALGVAEMLPAPGQLWLPDAEDRRYTSELRLVAVDLAGR